MQVGNQAELSREGLKAILDSDERAEKIEMVQKVFLGRKFKLEYDQVETVLDAACQIYESAQDQLKLIELIAECFAVNPTMESVQQRLNRENLSLTRLQLGRVLRLARILELVLE